MFNSSRITKNEQCPCGSGKAYKECCLGKPNKEFRAEGEMLAVLQKAFKKSLVKTCLHKSCNAKAKDIILAHALQENKILSQLCIDDEVIMISPKDQRIELLELNNGIREPMFSLDLIHKNKATVHTCFCKKHDDQLFSKIEKSNYPFSSDSVEQKFLFAYKTFIFEYYKEIASNKFYTNCFREIPQLIKNPMLISQYRQSQKKKEEMEYYKNFFDKRIEDKTYSDLITIVKKLPYRVNFSNYSCIAPFFGIDGKLIRTIKNKRMRRVFITIFPENESESNILISVCKEDWQIYENFINQMDQASIEQLKYYLNIILPFYSENIVISPKLWSLWTEEQKRFVQFMLNEVKPQKHLLTFSMVLRKLYKQGKTITEEDLAKMKINLFEQIEW